MRHDHTKWLMHFVRDRDPAQDFPAEDEDEFDYLAGGEIEPDASAFAVLKTIIRLGGITPGHSFRNGRTTIYGGSPAICVTEMPLYSFADYARSRADAAKVSAYGIAFLKSEFYEAGGRPAIYGLSIDNPKYVENTALSRIYIDDVLPRAEQYRYVAFNPISSDRWIDWSHEREWRWIPQDEETDRIWCLTGLGVFDTVPALPIFKGRLEGRPFSRVCIIVWTHEEAKEIRESLTGLYLAGHNNYDTPFDRGLIAASKIIVLQDVIEAVEKGRALESQTIEGLEKATLLESIVVAEEPENAADLVREAIDAAGEAAKAAADKFRKEYGEGGGYCGRTDAVTYEVTHPIVQYMLKTKAASGPFDGTVVIKFPTSFEPSQSMDFNEAVCEAAAEALSKALGFAVYMESRPD